MAELWPASCDDCLAVVTEHDSLTYSELRKRAVSAVEMLASRSLVFLQAENSLESLLIYIGCLLRSHPVFLFKEYNSQIAELARRYQPNAVFRADAGVWSLDTLHEAPTKAHPDLAVLLSTSGSTGTPKLVKLSAKNIRSNALAIRQYLELTPSDRAITSLDFNYSYGMSVINSHMAAGASILLTKRSVADREFWFEARAHRITNFAGVPYSFELLRNNRDWPRLPDLRFVTQAGGKLAPARVRELADLGARNGWAFYVMYGQTEAAPRIAYLPPELASEHPDCIGRPVPGGTIRLIDDDGNEVVEPETVGELCYRGPNVMMGYADGAAQLATDETPDGLLTGDLAVRNADNLYRIVGRSSRIVKPFGLRIDLDALERLAEENGTPCTAAGNDERIVLATTVGAEIPDVERLSGILRLPLGVVSAVRLDAIPRLANGKIDYTTILRSGDQPDASAETPGAGMSMLSHLISLYLRELRSIFGFETGEWRDVGEIYAVILNLGDIDPTSNFRDLAGDSLNYVRTAIALEDHLGFLPDEWESLTIAELDVMRR